jgi:hypothetical protein
VEGKSLVGVKMSLAMMVYHVMAISALSASRKDLFLRL